jgi:hypothetical protein
MTASSRAMSTARSYRSVAMTASPSRAMTGAAP